jgi:hypothetical protein
VAGGAAWLVTELLKGELAPRQCRWCGVDSVDVAARRALVWRDTSSASAVSDVTAFLLVPLATAGSTALAAVHDGASGNVPQDALLIAEATVLAGDVCQLTKMLVGRERPFVSALPAAQKLLVPHPEDSDLSFFSGHSTEAFALTAASGTIGVLRGYRAAPLAFGVGGALAVGTGYLRIAADRHWLTDVLVGAVVGGAIGFLVPYVFHSAADARPLAPASASGALAHAPAGTALTFAW